MTNEVATLQGRSLTENPFGNQGAVAPQSSGGNAMMTAEVQRGIAEVQAMTMLAMHNPRVPAIAMDKILIECQRKSLAEVAIYTFPRGGQTVTGPSIRLAEVIKRNWGHMRSGWRCLERTKGRSLIQAFAYDMQTNVGETREFEVRHFRDTRQGPKPLTDERDIYELEANQAARRVRACILALIDGDVIEAALDQCTRTLEAVADTSPENLKKMLEAFAPFKVNQKMVEARLGRNLSAITPAQLVGLRNILIDFVGKVHPDTKYIDKVDNDVMMPKDWLNNFIAIISRHDVNILSPNVSPSNAAEHLGEPDLDNKGFMYSHHVGGLWCFNLWSLYLGS